MPVSLRKLKLEELLEMIVFYCSTPLIEFASSRFSFSRLFLTAHDLQHQALIRKQPQSPRIAAALLGIIVWKHQVTVFCMDRVRDQCAASATAPRHSFGEPHA